MFAIEERIHEYFYSIYNWPPTDPINLMSLLVNFALLYLTWKTAKGATWAARRLQLDAGNTIQNGILKGLDYPAILTANHLRFLAYEMEKETGCPKISDKMIAETIRKVAFDLEGRLEGQNLEIKLNYLNSILLELDPKGIPLLSIANTDRILAFQLSVISIAILIFGSQLFLSILNLSTGMRIIVLCLGVILYAWLISANLRSFLSWSHRANLRHNFILDTFYLMANSVDDRVHTLWAPFWEEIAFRFLPTMFFPFIMYFIIIQIGKVLNINISSIQLVANSGLLIAFLVGVYISIFKFSMVHEYKVFEKQTLLKELNRIEKEIFKNKINSTQIPENLILAKKRISIKLWIITGDKYYRKLIEN